MMTPTPGSGPQRTRVILLIDRSASMIQIRDATVSAVNSQADGVRSGASANGQIASLTLISFGGEERYGNDRYDQRRRGHLQQLPPVFVHYENVPVGQVPPMTRAEYVPAGNTPFLSAIGTGITLAKESGDWGNPSVAFLFVVVTDGEENSSVRFRRDAVTRLMAEADATDRCTFAFSVPNENEKRALAREYGIPADCIQTWEQTTAGTEEMTRSTTSGLSSYFQARSTGATRSTCFYVDAQQLTKTEVRQNLTDISSKTRALTVDGAAPGGVEWEIRPFVEARGLTFVTGAAYVELTKPETLLDQHQLAVRERGKTAIYTGAEARSLLGLPATAGKKGVPIRPGNYGEWEVFKQSTSTNRKLPRGVRIIYRLDVQADAVKETWDPVKAEADALARQRRVIDDTAAPAEDRVWAAIRLAGGTAKNAVIAKATGYGEHKIRKAHDILKTAGKVRYAGQTFGWELTPMPRTAARA